jgi:16S rRNA A1518/A1519 N6-dimethyltransferase RsmA/KsgA/DIM1 with predicted DNA glycosylase/AP lyase activity
MRRKTVRNGLKGVKTGGGTALEGEALDAVLFRSGVSARARPEDIDVASWGRLAHEVACAR